MGKKINRLEVPVKQIIVGVGIKRIQQYLSCGRGILETETGMPEVIGSNKLWLLSQVILLMTDCEFPRAKCKNIWK